MGRKSTKGKEKKLKRKEELAKINAAQALVDKANEIDDHLAKLAPFKRYNHKGLDVTIECRRVTELNKDEVQWVFDVTKRNMQTLYETSPWGWNDKKKMDEMTDHRACYLMAKDEQGKFVGMSHFRFDLDEGDEVLYCYEIQLEREYCAKGLGKRLMQILELMAHRSQMKKVMLTVFKDNAIANKFFGEKLRYEVDETSPSVWDPMNPEDYHYEIMSKIIKKPSAEENDAVSA